MPQPRRCIDLVRAKMNDNRTALRSQGSIPVQITFVKKVLQRRTDCNVAQTPSDATRMSRPAQGSGRIL